MVGFRYLTTEHLQGFNKYKVSNSGSLLAVVGVVGCGCRY
jgi:hypothetical protein